MSKQAQQLQQQLSQSDLFELEKKYAELEAKVCDAQNAHKRIVSAIQSKEQELKEFEKKIGCFISYDAFDKFFAEKKKEVENIDKMIEQKKKEADAFVSNIDIVKRDHEKRMAEMSDELENKRKAFDVYVVSKNNELEKKAKEITDKEKYIEVEIGLLSLEKEENNKAKQSASVVYTEAQKIQEKSQQVIKEYESKLSDLEKLQKEVIEKSKELSTQIQDHTDKNNLLTKTLSENLFLKGENDRKKNELDITIQDTLKKQKEYDECLSKIKDKEVELYKNLDKLSKDLYLLAEKETNCSNRERSIKARERELTFQEADYKEKYNQFLLTLKQKGLKLSEMQL